MQKVVVTSMSAKYYKMSGQTWLSSLMSNNRYHVIPYIVSEDMGQGLYVHHFTRQAQYKRFVQIAEEAMKDKDITNYRWQAVRFCHKVFAIEQAFYKFTEHEIYWFDADVEFTGPIDFEAIEPPFTGVSSLGRSAWTHTEGGCIGIGEGATDFIDTWLGFYLSGALFKLQEWHDMYAFDTTLLLTQCPNRNLTENIHKKHVWPDSVLASFSKHHKGPGRKLEAFGTNEAIGNTVLQPQDDVRE